MPHLRLTDRRLQALRTDRPQEDFFDASLPGFSIRVTPDGRKTFVLRYRAGELRRRLTIGTYPALPLAEARSRAKAALYAVANGTDPQGEKEAWRKAETFLDLATEYLAKHAKVKKRSWQEDERKLRKEVLPYWGKRKAKEITRRDVIVLLDRLVDRGAPIQANRVKALVSKVFNFGISRGIVETNPAHLVERPALETQRDRVLTEEEIRALWQALEGEDPTVAASFKLRLLTAQRGSEVMKMRWADLSGEWWTIPATLAKNRLQHRVPLSPQARAVIEGLRPLTGDSEWILASSRKPGSPRPVLHKAIDRVRKASGVDFVPHDLRRTAASSMTSMGISRLVVSKILNHVERGVTAVYDRHSYDAEKRAALVRWGSRLESLLAGESEESNVLRIA